MASFVIQHCVLFGLLLVLKESVSFEATIFVDVGYCQNHNPHVAICQGIDAGNATDIIFAYDIRQSEVLRIINSNLPTIPVGIFALETAVTEVQITNAKLKHIPLPAFQGGDQIKYLDLSVNNISTLSERVFGNLKKLMELNLSSNKLRTLPEDLVWGKPDLYSLDISRNEIQFLKDDIFTESASLQYIYMSNNQLATIDPSTFHGLQIKELDLSYNQLNGTALEFLKGVNITSLNLNGNCLKDVPLETFGSHQELQTLLLSQTCLSGVQYGTFPNSLQTLDISRNYLRNFETDYLITSPKITNLNVESCDMRGEKLIELINMFSLDTIHFDGSYMRCDVLSQVIRVARKANVKYSVAYPVFHEPNIEGIQCMYTRLDMLGIRGSERD